MKTYQLIFFIAIHFSIFGMKRSHVSTGTACFDTMPAEIKVKILYKVLTFQPNMILQEVCSNWKTLIRDPKNHLMEKFLKETTRKNQRFLMEYKKRRLKVNIEFLHSLSFNVRYKNPKIIGYYNSVVSMAIFRDDIKFLSQIINNKDLILYKEGITALVNKYTCQLNDKDECIINTPLTEHIMLDYLLKHRKDLFSKHKHDFFKAIVIDGHYDYLCFLKKILPYLEIHNPHNMHHYLNCIVEKQEVFEDEFNADEIFSRYLTLFMQNGANLQAPADSSSDDHKSLAATFAEKVDVSIFPLTRTLLQAQITM